MMTTIEIADVIIITLAGRQFPIYLTSFYGRGFDEADVLGINRNGFIYEYEIKRSRADYLADFKNKTFKHTKLRERDAIRIYDEYKNGHRTGNKNEFVVIPNNFYFVCEEGLIKKEEVPEYAGLIYCYESYMMEIKPSKRLHNNKANIILYARIATVLSQRQLFGNAYYKYKHSN